MIKENLRKDLFVKQIQAPWPEPNQINHEYCDRDYENCSNRADPFENALKHVVRISACRMQQQCAVDSRVFEVHTDQTRQLIVNQRVIQEFVQVPRVARNDGNVSG